VTETQLTWLLANWQVIFGVLVVSCIAAFGLLVGVICWTLVR
jgi:hypothetical protein